MKVVFECKCSHYLCVHAFRNLICINDLVKEPKDLSTGLLCTSFVVIHNAICGSEDKVAKSTRRKDVLHPLLNLVRCDIKARRDHSTLVDAPNKVHDNLAGAVVIQHLKLADVTCTLSNISI